MLFEILIKKSELIQDPELKKSLCQEAFDFAKQFGQQGDESIAEDLFLFLGDIIKKSKSLDEEFRIKLLQDAYEDAQNGKQKFPEGAMRFFKTIVEQSVIIQNEQFKIRIINDSLQALYEGLKSLNSFGNSLDSDVLYCFTELIKNEDVQGDVEIKELVYKTAQEVVKRLDELDEDEDYVSLEEGDGSDDKCSSYSLDELKKLLNKD